MIRKFLKRAHELEDLQKKLCIKKEENMTYSIEEAKEFVIKAGLELSAAGLVARTWGNISARISDHQFVITPSGRGYDSLTPADIVVVNIADGSYEGNVKPSGEKGVHAAVYEMRPGVNFVIHTHQNYASALSILGEVIPVKDDDDRLILGDEIPCAEYGMYATKKLVNAIKEQMWEHERSKAVLMKYHGALCMGRDYEEAFAAAYILEKISKEEYENRCGKPEGAEETKRGNSRTESDSSTGVPTFDGQGFDIDDTLKGVLERKFGTKEVIFVQTPFIKAVSSFGKKQRPYLDDSAQIAGADVCCVPKDANTSQLLNALENRNAVFIKDAGALCTGVDMSEAEAVGIVLEKNCMAAYLAEKTGKIKPLNLFSAIKDRKGYISHYSKLK